MNQRRSLKEFTRSPHCFSAGCRHPGWLRTPQREPYLHFLLFAGREQAQLSGLRRHLGEKGRAGHGNRLTFRITRGLLPSIPSVPHGRRQRSGHQRDHLQLQKSGREKEEHEYTTRFWDFPRYTAMLLRACSPAPFIILAKARLLPLGKRFD